VAQTEEGASEGAGAASAGRTSWSTGQRTLAEWRVTIEWMWLGSRWMSTGWCTDGSTQEHADEAGGGGDRDGGKHGRGQRNMSGGTHTIGPRVAQAESAGPRVVRARSTGPQVGSSGPQWCR
jgi:hypothetical protein